MILSIFLIFGLIGCLAKEVGVDSVPFWIAYGVAIAYYITSIALGIVNKYIEKKIEKERKEGRQ